MKYMQINETGYTPCGKWRVVPTEYSPPVYLLERKENGLSWYIGAATRIGWSWHWTADVNSAVRFSRKEDAAACWSVIKYHVGVGGSGTTETVPTQHIFEECAAIKSAPTPPAKLVLSGEPIGWGDSRQVSTRTSFKVMWSPKCWPEGFASPLYLHPAPDASTVGDTERQAKIELNARRYLALREDGVYLYAGEDILDGEDLDAAADRLLEGEE